MKTHKAAEALLDEAERNQRLAYGSPPAMQMALLRRLQAGDVVRPHPNLYARAGYWGALNPRDRAMHIARSLGWLHPEWAFGGLIAATAHGLEHQWSLHTGQPIMVVVRRHRGGRSNARIRRVTVPGSEPIVTAGGLRVTTMARTVVDCGALLPFRTVLPMVNSAMARGVSEEELLSCCDRMRHGRASIMRLVRFADPRCENGGESLALGTIVELGYLAPMAQVAFVDPETGRRYRADFVWRLPDGRTIVGELDGRRKYVDADMTRGRDVDAVIAAERERQRGLERAGVTDIVRFAFQDALDRAPLDAKLREHGVPRMA